MNYGFYSILQRKLFTVSFLKSYFLIDVRHCHLATLVQSFAPIEKLPLNTLVQSFPFRWRSQRRNCLFNDSLNVFAIKSGRGLEALVWRAKIWSSCYLDRHLSLRGALIPSDKEKVFELMFTFNDWSNEYKAVPFPKNESA